MNDRPLFSRLHPIGDYILIEVFKEIPIYPESGIFKVDPRWAHRFARGRILRLGGRAEACLKAHGAGPGAMVYFPQEHFDYGSEKHVHHLLKDGSDEYHILKWFDLLGVATEKGDAIHPVVS